MEAVDGLRFTPLAAPAGLEAQFQFTPVFSDGRSGDAVTVELYLLAEANGAPVAENLEFTTYKNVAVTAQFSAVDPEGDLLTYHILNKPARGAVTMPEDGSSEFVYTPMKTRPARTPSPMWRWMRWATPPTPLPLRSRLKSRIPRSPTPTWTATRLIRSPSDWQRRDLRGRVHGWGLFLPARRCCDPRGICGYGHERRRYGSPGGRRAHRLCRRCVDSHLGQALCLLRAKGGTGAEATAPAMGR
ncbi:MAG: Ig-like domain-containing protein [Flavonifractor plautii]